MPPQKVDGRSNRRRFSDEQKRAIVQEMEKPVVSVAEVCRRHGIATSMAFRWRVEFGGAARKAPQLATVALLDGVENEPPALATLRGLLRRPDGMMAIELEDGQGSPVQKQDAYLRGLSPLCTILDTSVPRENRSFKIVTAGVAARKTGAFQVSRSVHERWEGVLAAQFQQRIRRSRTPLPSAKIGNRTRCSGFALFCGPAETGA